jgi:hypothetical protein
MTTGAPPYADWGCWAGTLRPGIVEPVESPVCAAGDVVTDRPGRLVAATSANTPVNAVAPSAE